ncbi:glycosyltransferase family 2 protein [Sinomonas humi]|uniref:glycosyltransferase family 2 protein n=1 Tax=Sinomonas humi TaxID=1338436 RepID=UPI00068E4177|nr:glycosyltransferase family 2 protein [Sinomonas humi]
MLRGTPTVSVAIASYNYAHYLGDSIESALNQEGVRLEVVVVDDASRDDSVAVANRIASRDSRVKVFAHERNQGHIATFNEALGRCSGEFLVKLDSDDMLTAGSLARSASALQSHGNVGFVYGNPLTFETQTPPARTAGPGRLKVWSGRHWTQLRCRRGDNVIMQPEVMMRASVFRATGGHRANLPATHDLNVWLRMAAIADVARLGGVDQGFYRVHTDSLLRSSFGSYLADLQGRLDAFEDFFRGMQGQQGAHADIDQWRSALRRRLSQQALVYALRVRSGAASGEVQPYLDFARETSDWSLGEMRVGLGYRPEWYFRIGDKVRWRWWRRFGT